MADAPVETLETKMGVTRLSVEAHGKHGNGTIPWSFAEELDYSMGRTAAVGFGGFYKAV